MEANGGLGALYCGGRGASLKKFVETNKIKAVCNASNLHLAERRDFKEWARKVEVLEKDGTIDVLRMGWEDDGNQKLEGLIDAVVWVHNKRQEGKNVVVHCAQGKSRSGAIVVAYLMALEGKPYEDCLKKAQTARQMIQPNIGFEEQIKSMQKDLFSALN